jgi:hypothetical protein
VLPDHQVLVDLLEDPEHLVPVVNQVGRDLSVCLGHQDQSDSQDLQAPLDLTASPGLQDLKVVQDQLEV